MKTLILLGLLMSASISYSQNKRMEQKSIIENGLVKKWVIEKEFDNQGNLVKADSSYTETPMSESEDGNFYFYDSSGGMNFQFGNGRPDPFGHQLDSLGFNNNQWQQNFEEILKNYQQQLHQEFNTVPTDTIKQEDQFIFPEDKKSGKKI